MRRFDSNPPFTTSQLEALVIPEMFPVIDWPAIFGVTATPLRQALEETYLDPRYAQHRPGFLSGATRMARLSSSAPGPWGSRPRITP